MFLTVLAALRIWFEANVGGQEVPLLEVSLSFNGVGVLSPGRMLGTCRNRTGGSVDVIKHRDIVMPLPDCGFIHTHLP